jgi:hypothetical protein
MPDCLIEEIVRILERKASALARLTAWGGRRRPGNRRIARCGSSRAAAGGDDAHL